ncbi:MAG: hypothetical protein KatS3mg068_1270 [Candidatus Sericytochromatia bacterium]|nr:MAG: hypothetical protein KatS3mg068_1270 [Candidatus Sericytochromatia bacterium]
MKKTLLLSFCLLFTFSCSNQITDLENSIDNLSVQSTTLSTESTILEQINQNKIEETEWGIKVSKLPVSKNNKKVTFLSYLAFDNDKGSYRDELKPVINFHEISGSNSNLNIVLQTDSAENRDMKRYYIVKDNDQNLINSAYTQFKNERNSANYRVLQAFINWGFSTYPSNIKILDINTHGGAYLGIATDDGAGKIISLPNFGKAIRESVGKVDLLNLDACLMATTEAAFELKDVADVIIGSEDSTLSTGMLYNKELANIINRNNDVDDIARDILLSSDRKGVDFRARLNRKGKYPNVFTISAFRTSKISDYVKELDKLSIMLMNYPNKKAIKVALNGTHPLHVDSDSLGGQRDVYEILSRLNTIIDDKNIKEQIIKTRNALNKVIILSRNHNTEKHAQGMAINISPISVGSNEYKNTLFAKNTKWDEFILSLN